MVVVVLVVVLGATLAVGLLVPSTTPPLVVGAEEEEGEAEVVGEGEGEVEGSISNFGSTLEEGAGEREGINSGSLTIPTDLRTISPIAPTIIAATRPERVCFMSYILSRKDEKSSTSIWL